MMFQEGDPIQVYHPVPIEITGRSQTLNGVETTTDNK